MFLQCKLQDTYSSFYCGIYTVKHVFTLETTLTSLPEGPRHASQQPSVLWHDKVIISHAGSWVQPEHKSNAYLHVARFSLLTLLTLGQNIQGHEALQKSHQEQRYLKDALSMCRLTNKSTQWQNVQVFLTVDLLSLARTLKLFYVLS